MSALNYSNNLRPIVELPLRINYARYALAISDEVLTGISTEEGENGSILDLKECYFKYNLDSVDSIKDVINQSPSDSEIDKINNSPVTFNSANALIDYAITGLKGQRGSTGVQGPRGTDIGLQGATGSQGIQGFKGITGEVGYQGYQGPQGVSSQIGPTGSRGITGSKGTQGPIGIQGYTGIVGHTGAQGVRGSNGSAGPIGPTGYRGITGLQGITGSKGDTITNPDISVKDLAEFIKSYLSNAYGVGFTGNGIICGNLNCGRTITAKKFYDK
jgi:hypothetical protein